MSGRRPRAWRLRESAQHCPSSTREASSLFINKPREAMARVQGHAASRDRRPPGSGPAPSCPALTDALSHPGPNSAPRRGPGSDLHVICEMGSQAPPCRATVKPGGPAKVTRSLPQKPRETQRNPGPCPGHRPLRELLESAHCIPGPARPATPSPPPAPPPAGIAGSRHSPSLSAPWRGCRLSCQCSISAHSVYKNASEGLGVAIWS